MTAVSWKKMFFGSMEFYGVVHLHQVHTEHFQLFWHLSHRLISKLHQLKLTFELHEVNLFVFICILYLTCLTISKKCDKGEKKQFQRY